MLIVVVGLPLILGHRKREPGRNPGLTRSGIQEREPSLSTALDKGGKRWLVGSRL